MECLTKEALTSLFDKMSKEKLIMRKTVMSSGMFGSIWGTDIVTTEVLTEEEKLERRILNKGW